MSLKVGGLFAGYGGIELALSSVLDTEPAWFCEFEAAPSKILAHHWPEVPNFGDVTKVDWAAVEPVDIITGGSPCQDLSHAGKRAGMKAGTRSGLWASMCDAIDIIRPRLVVWENVRGALSAEADSAMEQCPRCVGDPRDGGPVLRALGRVLGDLSDLGYDAWWYGLRAADVGAAHGRFRVFVFAAPRNSEGLGVEGFWSSGVGVAHALAGTRVPDSSGVSPALGQPRADLTRNDIRISLGEVDDPPVLVGIDEAVQLGERPHIGWDRPVCDVVDDLLLSDGENVHATDGTGSKLPGQGFALFRTPTSQLGINGGSQHPDKRKGGGHGPTLADEVEHLLPAPGVKQDWAEYDAAIRRQEKVFGSLAPLPTDPGKNGQPRLSPSFVEWLMGLPAGHVTDPAIGISRNDQLKALGNGVVPQQAAAALRAFITDISEGVAV